MQKKRAARYASVREAAGGKKNADWGVWFRQII